MSTLGNLASSSDTILNMIKDVGIDNKVQISIVKKIKNIAVSPPILHSVEETRRGLTLIS